MIVETVDGKIYKISKSTTTEFDKEFSKAFQVLEYGEYTSWVRDESIQISVDSIITILEDDAEE